MKQYKRINTVDIDKDYFDIEFLEGEEVMVRITYNFNNDGGSIDCFPHIYADLEPKELAYLLYGDETDKEIIEEFKSNQCQDNWKGFKYQYEISPDNGIDYITTQEEKEKIRRVWNSIEVKSGFKEAKEE